MQQTSYLGLMVKRLNRIENIIDKFEDSTSNLADYLYEKYSEENSNYDPRKLEKVEIVGGILMSMMLPGLIVATFFLVSKLLYSLIRRIKMKRLYQIAAPNSYKRMNKMIKLDPEMLALPRNRKTCMFSVRIFLTIIMILAVFLVFLGHCYVWNKSGANIDSANNFSGDTPASLRELHTKMSSTLEMVNTHLVAVQEYMPSALAELSHLTSVDVQEIIEAKIDRVTSKGGEFSDLASNLDNFVLDSDNKSFSIFLSLCFTASSVVSMWFWYLLISYKFEQHLGWLCALVWWCSTFLALVLVNIYSSMFIPYLCTSIQPDSDFMLRIIGA